jgi:hypothetical protein
MLTNVLPASRPIALEDKRQSKIVQNARKESNRNWRYAAVIAEEQNEPVAMLNEPQAGEADGVGRFLQLTDMHFDIQYKVITRLLPSPKRSFVRLAENVELYGSCAGYFYGNF